MTGDLNQSISEESAYLRYMQKISGKLSYVLRYSDFVSPTIFKIMGCRKLDPKNHCTTYKQKQALNLGRHAYMG